MEPITSKSIGLDGEVVEDRRSEQRRRVLKGGTLSYNKGYGALECVVRNLSGRGACLAFGETAGVPPRFALKISGESLARSAQVRWRSLTNVGVEFDTGRAA